MTHSAHRQGTYSSLSDDFVVLGFPGREFDDLDATLEQFQQIGNRHQPVNVSGVTSRSGRHLVYDSKEKVQNVLRELVAADLGLSITVSGLRDQIGECCHSVGLSPHTVCNSLGFWGRTDLLPPFNILEITTMCGHGRVPPNLVWDLAGKVQRQSLNPNEASRRMGKLCLCNIFNEVRAARLLRRLAADLAAGINSQPLSVTQTDTVPKDFGVTVDEGKCTVCMDCIPYCPVSAIVESPARNTVSIDAERCTECGLCLQSGVCPVEAIVAKDLTWPRTLRGKFHTHRALYRDTPLLAQGSPPLNHAGDGKIFIRSDTPGELQNDVKGLIGHGEAEIIAELGRPHVASTFRDLQQVVRALLPFGLRLEQQYPPLDQRSPLSDLATVPSKGVLRQEILDEKIGWVFLSLHIPEEQAPKIVDSLRRAAAGIDTVLAIGVVSRVGKNGTTAADQVTRETDVKSAANCKTNVGLGRPLAP